MHIQTCKLSLSFLIEHECIRRPMLLGAWLEATWVITSVPFTLTLIYRISICQEIRRDTWLKYCLISPIRPWDKSCAWIIQTLSPLKIFSMTWYSNKPSLRSGFGHPCRLIQKNKCWSSPQTVSVVIVYTMYNMVFGYHYVWSPKQDQSCFSEVNTWKFWILVKLQQPDSEGRPHLMCSVSGFKSQEPFRT